MAGGGLWDAVQTLSGGRVEWPTGPIDGLEPNAVPTWVEAWVVQGGGEVAGRLVDGASQSSSHGPSWSGWGSPPYERWTANSPGWASGTFQAGHAALGITLLATYDPTKSIPQGYDWWFEVIGLQ